MQKDYHHAVTYVVARLAGMPHGEANTVAHCAQYVDDATNDGELRFDNGAMYRRLASAHKMLDYKNLEELENHLVWVPYHFLPGNGGLPAGENPDGSFIEKLICWPNSPVAHDMIRETIAERERPYGLHRLGVSAHVFVDTWAHQGFAGIKHEVNEVSDLRGADGEPDESLIDRVADYFSGLLQSQIPSLGHGQALSNPDLPYAEWSYTDGLGRQVVRNNRVDFVEAADELCKVFQRYLAGNPDAAVAGLQAADRDRIADKLWNTVDHDADVRHGAWLTAIEDDDFGFGPEQLSYIAKGEGSWKHQAVDTTGAVDGEGHEFHYDPSFLVSDWKMFHDAAKAHRLSLIDIILPRYGICAA